MAEKKKDFPLPNQIAWNGICGLQQQREVVRSQLVIAEDDLKDARANLSEVGSNEKSEEFRDAAAMFVRCETERDYRKRKLVELARDIDAAILAASKGEGKLFDDIDLTKYSKAPTAEDLYGKATKEDPAQQQLPVGKPGKVKPEQPDPALADGHEQHMAASVHELECNEQIKGKLTAAGMTKVSHAASFLRDLESSDKKLQAPAQTQANEFTDKQLETVKKAVGKYVKQHNKAQVEVEREAIGA